MIPSERFTGWLLQDNVHRKNSKFTFFQDVTKQNTIIFSLTIKRCFMRPFSIRFWHYSTINSHTSHWGTKYIREYISILTCNQLKEYSFIFLLVRILFTSFLNPQYHFDELLTVINGFMKTVSLKVMSPLIRAMFVQSFFLIWCSLTIFYVLHWNKR